MATPCQPGFPIRYTRFEDCEALRLYGGDWLAEVMREHACYFDPSADSQP